RQERARAGASGTATGRARGRSHVQELRPAPTRALWGYRSMPAAGVQRSRIAGPRAVAAKPPPAALVPGPVPVRTHARVQAPRVGLRAPAGAAQVRCVAARVRARQPRATRDAAGAPVPAQIPDPPLRAAGSRSGIQHIGGARDAALRTGPSGAHAPPSS